MSKRSEGPTPSQGARPETSKQFASSMRSRRPEYPASSMPGPHRLVQFSKSSSVALSPFAVADKSGSLTGRASASVFLARAPAAADARSAKPEFEYRQSSPAEVLRPTVLRMAAQHVPRQSVKRSRVMRSQYPVAFELAPGSPRDMLSSLSRERRQAAHKRMRCVLRKRFASPEA